MADHEDHDDIDGRALDRMPDLSWMTAHQLQTFSDDEDSQRGINSCAPSASSATLCSSRNDDSVHADDDSLIGDNSEDDPQHSPDDSGSPITSISLGDVDDDDEENSLVRVSTKTGGEVNVVTADLMRSHANEKKNAQLTALRTLDFVKPDYLKHFPQKSPFKQRLSACLTSCKYDSVHRVLRRLGIQEVDEVDCWNIMWTDSCASLAHLLDMKKYQKINHFPGMMEVCRKDLLARNMKRMKRAFLNEYDIFPETWCLPSDYSLLQHHAKKHRKHSYILKPETGSQGRGIWVTRDASRISPSEHILCQLYISKPFLIDGFKFDLRVYVLVTSVDPLRIYVFKDGLARFCTVKYVEPRSQNVKNVYMHLTNYAVNKKSDGFIRNDESKGSKRRIRSINKWLVDRDYDIIEMWAAIDDVIIKTLVSASTSLRQNYRSCFLSHEKLSACFEILGFDVILDRNLRPYLLEVNHSPSFHTDSKLDREIKDALIHDTICLLNFDAVNRKKWSEEERKKIQLRLITVKAPKKDGVQDSSDMTIEKDSLQTDTEAAYENEHLGNFRRIYPSPDGADKYDRFLLTTKSIYTETAAFRARVECSRQQRETICRKREELDLLMKRKYHLRPESPVVQKLATQRKQLDRSAARLVNTHLPVNINDRDEKRRIEGMALRRKLVTSMGIVTVVGRLFDSIAAGYLLTDGPLLYPPAFRGHTTVRQINNIAQQNQPMAWNRLISPPRQTHINVLNVGLYYPTWQQQSNAISATAPATQRKLNDVDHSTLAAAAAAAAARSSHSAAMAYQQSSTIMATSRELQQQQLQSPLSHESATRMLNRSQLYRQQQQQQPRFWNRRR